MAIPALERYDPFVGGEFRPPREGARFESIDPARGHAWAEVGEASPADVDECVRTAAAAFAGEEWRSLSASARGLLLLRLADAIDESAERLAELETRDNGKLHRDLMAQLRTVPDWLRYFGGLADKVEGRTIPLDRISIFNYTIPEPLGVVAVISPWNSPIFLALMSAAPALAAGNTVVVKPSEVTSVSILEVARLASEVGFPPGTFNVITGAGATGRALVDHPDVAKIAFTGGTEAGRAVALAAAGRLARTTLELGGKSANIVFEDADLERAEGGILAGIFANAGQTCVAGSRALVHERAFDRLVERLAARADQIKLGDPMDADTEVGPVATLAQLEKVDSFVERARSEGAEVIAGGKRAALPELPDGYFYRPTVINGAKRDSDLAQNEVFGPVLAVLPFRSEDEAIAIANDTRYGLAAGVWTQDVNRAHRMARALETGTVWVNMYRAIAPQTPFGGFKQSGIGVQNGQQAMQEYLQTKSVWVELSEEVQDPFAKRS